MLVLGIGAVVTFIVFTWVTFSVRRAHESIDMRDRLNARYAAESVVSAALYARMINPTGALSPDSVVQIVHAGDTLNQTAEDSSLIYVDSLHGSKASATLSEEGSYICVAAKGEAGEATYSVSALFGQELPKEFNYALILSIQNKPLEVRRGRIIGDVKTAQPPSGSIDGKIDAGRIVTLPQVDESKLTSAMSRLEEKISISDSGSIQYLSSQAFDERTLPKFRGDSTIFVNGHVLISGGMTKPLVIKGPGSIVAAGDIQITGMTDIEDVNLIATGQIKCFDDARLGTVTLYAQKSIYLDNQARVSGNLYAFSTITLAGESSITMPSFAYVKGSEGKDPKKNICGLQLMDQARFSGTFFCAYAGPTSYSLIEKDTRFTGLLYTRGRLELGGTVFGCVAAFSLAVSMEDDRNTLAGGLVNRRLLPKNFMVPPAFGQKGAGYKLVSWDDAPPAPALPSDSTHEVADE
jgi:hypothetical protein